MSGLLSVLVASNGGGAGPPPGGTETLDPAKKASNLTLSNGNLTATATASDINGQMALSVNSHASGSYYFEVLNVIRAGGTGSIGTGLVNASQVFTNGHYPGENNNGFGFYSDGNWFINAVLTTTGVLWQTQGQYVGIAVNATTRKVWATANGTTWNGGLIGAENPVGGVGGLNISAISGALFAVGYADVNTNVVTMNFGATAYQFSVPSGYSNW